MNLSFRALLLGTFALAHCGGRAEDRTLLRQPPAEPEAVESGRSLAIEALAEPAARDSFCGWLGANVGNLSSSFGPPLDCESVTEQCRDAATDPALDAPLDTAAALLNVPGDLEAVLGCPATVAEIDACVADVIRLVVARYPDGPGCGAPVPAEPLSPRDLPALTNCVRLAGDCPQLLQQLLDYGSQ